MSLSRQERVAILIANFNHTVCSALALIREAENTDKRDPTFSKTDEFAPATGDGIGPDTVDMF
jgi:hypothetical protein